MRHTAPSMIELARRCETIINGALADGIRLDDGNVVDLLADNIEGEPIARLKDALGVSIYGTRYAFAHGVRR